MSGRTTTFTEHDVAALFPSTHIALASVLSKWKDQNQQLKYPFTTIFCEAYSLMNMGTVVYFEWIPHILKHSDCNHNVVQSFFFKIYGWGFLISFEMGQRMLHVVLTVLLCEVNCDLRYWAVWIKSTWILHHKPCVYEMKKDKYMVDN